MTPEEIVRAKWTDGQYNCYYLYITRKIYMGCCWDGGTKPRGSDHTDDGYKITFLGHTMKGRPRDLALAKVMAVQFAALVLNNALEALVTLGEGLEAEEVGPRSTRAGREGCEMTPQEIAQKVNALPEAERLAEITKFLEMIQAAITIRSACRGTHFVSMSGGEDAGTKFDRLLKELFGMEWKDEPKKTPRRKRGDAK